VGPAPRVGAGRRPAPGQRLGGKEPPRLRLLRRPQALPDAARGVQAPARRDRLVTKTKANESDHTILLDWSVHDDDILVCFLVRKTGLIVGGWIKVVCVHCVWAHGQSGPMVVALETDHVGHSFDTRKRGMDSVLYHQSKFVTRCQSRYFHLVKLDSRPNTPV
jgi:hypothetical protein